MRALLVRNRVLHAVSPPASGESIWKSSLQGLIRIHLTFVMVLVACLEYGRTITISSALLLVLRRPLSDAEKRLHEAAENGKCDEIKALAADGTEISCPDPNYVRVY